MRGWIPIKNREQVRLPIKRKLIICFSHSTFKLSKMQTLLSLKKRTALQEASASGTTLTKGSYSVTLVVQVVASSTIHDFIERTSGALDKMQMMHLLLSFLIFHWHLQENRKACTSQFYLVSPQRGFK